MTVRTADRTLDIFESFARRQKPITVSELARDLSLPTSTCFALVRTLVDRGFLYYLQPRGALYPTRRLGLLAEAIAQHDPIAQHIMPLLNALRDTTGETVILGKLQGVGVTYLAIAESRQAIRFARTGGVAREPHVSSIGKAILSAMGEEPRSRLLSQLKYEPLTEHSLRSRAQLERSIDEGHERGYWTNVMESVPDVMGIAQPVRMLGDLYGITIVGPQFRVGGRVQSYVAALTATVRQIAELRPLIDDE